jgi:hypothetical protein
MNLNSISPQPTLVKTGPGQLLVSEPATAESLYLEVAARLGKGSPFVTLAGAFQGYERLAVLSGWQIGLTYFNKVVYLQANTRTQRQPLLEVATRQGKGRYQVSLTRAAFEKWIEPLCVAPKAAPVPAELSQIPGLTPASAVPLYDLLIASKKYGVGSTSQADAPITWWKMAGQDKYFPKSARLTDPEIQKRLAAYELVETEVHPNEIVRKYRRLAGSGA